MKGGVVALLAVVATLPVASGAFSGSRALGPLDVKPGPVPESDGTPACDDARAFLRQMNGDVARFNARLGALEQAVAAAKTPAAKARALDELRAFKQNEAKLQAAVDGQAKTAAQQCKAVEPSKRVVAQQFVLPDDNGTPACKTVRAQMKYLLDERRKVTNNLDRQYWSLGLGDAARRQLETRKARLEAQFRALAPKGAAACKARDVPPSPTTTATTPAPPTAPSFTGTWTGTYREGANSCTGGKSGAATMKLTQTGSSLAGSATYEGYVIGQDCATVDLHATVSGTVDGNTARISSTYDHDGGVVAGTLTLLGNGNELTLSEGEDGASFSRR